MDETQGGTAEAVPQEVIGQWPVHGIDEEPTMAWNPVPAGDEPDDPSAA